jgi:hypothetical protein
MRPRPIRNAVAIPTHTKTKKMKPRAQRSASLGCLNAGIDFLGFDLPLLFGHFAAIYFGRHFEALRSKELN